MLHRDRDTESAHALAGVSGLEKAREAQTAALRSRKAMPDVARLYADSAFHFGRSAELATNPCAARRNQAVALREAGDLAGSRAALSVVRDRCGADIGFQLELAVDALCHGEIVRARGIYEGALARWPSDPRLHAAYALALLGEGEFERGWREYEWRLRLPEFASGAAAPFPIWSGEALAGRSLLVEGEQGLGDQIMFASCVPDLLASGAQVLIETSSRLKGLFETSFPQALVIARARGGQDWAQLAKIDWRVPIGSLPRHFRSARRAFEGRSAYLEAPPALVETYRRRLDELGPGRKLGLAWRGGLPGTMRALRSIDFDALQPILSLRDIVFVSLELGDCQREIEIAAARGARVAWWPEAAYDMMRLAALVSALDGVVSVATTAVHMAGALGRPTWALVAPGGTWRYMWEGATMPWYPSVRVLRPAKDGDWRHAVESVAVALLQQEKSGPRGN